MTRKGEKGLFYETSLTGSSRGDGGFSFREHIELHNNNSKNLKLASINVNFNLPPGTTSNLNKNKLGIDKWENGELNTISLEPHVNEKLLSASWVVQDKQKPARAGGGEKRLTRRSI